MVYLFNPLFYNSSENDISSNVRLIYTKRINEQLYNPYGQNGGMYYASKFHMFSDLKINAGDVIRVNGKTTYVFSKTISENGCDIYCTGDPQRTPVVTENTDRISNLEADAYSSDYLTSDWINDNSTKIFNGNIQVNDIIIPYGIGYPGNTSNTSLVAVIQYLLGGA